MSVGEKDSLKRVDQEPVTSVLAPNDIPVLEGVHGSDDDVLAALGYKAEFKREFSLWSTFCVSFAVLGLLPSVASTLYYGLGYAGTPGMVWGWLIAMAFIQCIAMGMAELCSAMPTSGGLYYASAVLAPPKYGPFAAWVTGWSNWLGQVTGAPSVDYSLASMILAAVSINKPDYVPQNYQVFLLTVLLMVVHAVISSMPTKFVAQFNSVGSSFNIVALVVVFIVILAADNRTSQGLPRFNSSASVWGDFYAGTDFPKGVSILMSFIAVIWTMSGYDSPFHLSEECSNANIASPRAIVMTSGIGGAIGWALNMAIAYTIVDIDGALNDESGQPFAAYLLQILGDKAAMACLSLTIIAAFSMGQGCMVAASRVTFSYSRDGCLPLSRYWAKVNTHTKTPVNAVWLNCAVGCLSVLLIFAGDAAIGAIFSIGAIGAFVAFTIPISIRTFFVGSRFRPGPWNLGKFSYVNGVLSTMFTLLMIPILCLPAVTGSDLDAEGMNWTIVVWGGPMLFAIIWFFVDARKWFKGPKVNIVHMIHDVQADPYVIQAQEAGELDSNQPIVPAKKDSLSAA
ncbi:GABA/polyamine transporter [Sporothrix bragantina]|uniref:GABA/polyamine transporter n=1 Tax=Sporothrix bragantina TaxID=671064 RepID=A0ABP0ASD9_9PEZI